MVDCLLLEVQVRQLTKINDFVQNQQEKDLAASPERSEHWPNFDILGKFASSAHQLTLCFLGLF